MYRRKLSIGILVLLGFGVPLSGLSTFYFSQEAPDTTVINGRNYLIKVEATDGTYFGVDYSNAPLTIENTLNTQEQRYSNENITDVIIQWNKTYHHSSYDMINSMIQTKDSGFIFGGQTSGSGPDGWLGKTDATGNLEWQQIYGGSDQDSAWSVIQTIDGGFAFAGATSSYGMGNNDAWLVKTDVTGNMEWQQTYGHEGIDIATAIINTNDGGYAIAGYTDSYGGGYQDFWLIKTDAIGYMEWQQTYDSGREEWSCSMIQTQDGGYILVGYNFLTDLVWSKDTRYDGWVVKTDSNGRLEWEQHYGGDGDDQLFSVIETLDGGLAFSGESNSFSTGDKEGWLVKTDTTGNLEWQQTYSMGTIKSVIQTSDNGFIFVGYTKLVKTDANGNIEWDTTFDFFNIASVILTVSDGGYLLGGHMRASFRSDAWLVKLIPREFTPPLISAPDDLTFTEGSTGQILTWVVEDRNPDSYALYINSEQINSSTWTNGTISWSVDNFISGTYNVTLAIWDEMQNRSTDTIWVTVTTSEPNQPPLISAPDDFTTENGTINIITWTIQDRDPGIYELYTDAILMETGPWTNGTITWSPAGLLMGTYNVTLVVQDMAENRVSDTVWVTILLPSVTDVPTTLVPPRASSSDSSAFFVSGLTGIPLLLAMTVLGMLRKRKE